MPARSGGTCARTRGSGRSRSAAWTRSPSVRDLAALVALVHCLACHEALTADQHHPPVEILAEATFRALRDGVDATLSLGGPIRSVRDHARRALDLASGYAPGLGAAAPLADLERILIDGNGAVRQRRRFARGGMRAVLEHLRAETMMVDGVADAAGLAEGRA